MWVCQVRLYFIKPKQIRYKGQNHTREMIQSCSPMPDIETDGYLVLFVYSLTMLVLLHEDCRLQKNNFKKCLQQIDARCLHHLKNVIGVIESKLVHNSVTLFRIFKERWHMLIYKKDNNNKKSFTNPHISQGHLCDMWSREKTLI